MGAKRQEITYFRTADSMIAWYKGLRPDIRAKLRYLDLSQATRPSILGQAAQQEESMKANKSEVRGDDHDSFLDCFWKSHPEIARTTQT